MGKIEEAIKKINTEIQEDPGNEVFAKMGEYIIDQIWTEEDAEAILAEGKSLKDIFDKIKEEAYKKALEKRQGRAGSGWESIACDGESAINRIMQYFGLHTDPKTSAETPKKGVCIKLEDFF